LRKIQVAIEVDLRAARGFAVGAHLRIELGDVAADARAEDIQRLHRVGLERHQRQGRCGKPGCEMDLHRPLRGK